MAKDIKIAGASYTEVPFVTFPKTDGSGDAKFIDEDSVSYDTPSISVSSGGLITASANGKSNTSQLTTQASKTITPSESQQTAVASGRYTTGSVLVAAIPSNYIGSAVTINYYHIADTEPSVSSIPDGDFVFIRG